MNKYHSKVGFYISGRRGETAMTAEFNDISSTAFSLKITWNICNNTGKKQLAGFHDLLR
jgi:hypothetical protein